MRTFKLVFLFGLIAAVMASCTKDPDPLTVTAITATGVSFQTGSNVTSNLNGSTSANDVALNAVITINFDRAVDLATSTATNVKLSNAGGNLATTVTAVGSLITITPNDNFVRGTQYTLALNGVKAADGGNLPDVTRTFTTEGKAPVVVPKASEQVAYWNFDRSTNDVLGNYVTKETIKITYGTDRFGQAGSTASFDGDESIIEILNGDNLMKNKSFTLSFWVKTNSNGHVNENGNPAGYFVMGLAAFRGFQFEIPGSVTNCKLAMSYEMGDGTFQSEDLWFNGDGKTKDNGGWQGWDFAADLTGSGGVEGLLKDKWAHIICSYDAPSKKGMLFINGQLMKSQDFNLWPDNAAKKTTVGVGYAGMAPAFENILAFGFIKSRNSLEWANEPWGDYYRPTSNHFKGDLDDIRFFKASLTPAEALALYNAEK